MKQERATHEYVPAAMRPFTYQIAPGASRVRFTAAGEGARHWVVVLGVIVGVLVEGRASCYLRGPSGAGKLYDSVEAVDAAVARAVRR